MNYASYSEVHALNYSCKPYFTSALQNLYGVKIGNGYASSSGLIEVVVLTVV
jgi:hypothetical protein